MSFYMLMYIFGVLINMINFIDVIKNNPIAQLKLQLLNDKGKFYFYLQMFAFCFLSWILVFINFVYKVYMYIERKKR